MMIKLVTRVAPLVGVGILTALSAGCGNGLVSSGPATQSDLAKPSASSSATPSPSAGSTTGRTAAASPATGGSTTADHTSSSPTSPAGPAPSAGSDKPSSTSSDTATSQSSSSPQSTSTSASASSSRTCRLGNLGVGVQDSAGGAAAGSNYVVLTFTNKGGSTCRMYGYPGVSFVGDGNGTQLGAAADRSTAGKARAVSLAPGHRTTALLQIANAADFDAKTCAPTTSDGFRIYPPGSTVSAYVQFKTDACQRTGAKQLTVSPVGTSG